jgi:hypothetical protein
VFRGSAEPVTLRAILYVESPPGSFQQIVMKWLGQFGAACRASARRA